ncbi:MAG: phytanoyl-CoA dioxygenase family protein [Acidimicrobiales bacterium]
MVLTAAQIESYRTNGWIAPIDVLSVEEAATAAAALEAAEAQFPHDLHAEHRNNAHLAFPFLADLASHPTIVAAASQLVGPDITLSSTVLFVKEPSSSSFVSWHQDAFYMGLGPANFVTAWLALTRSNLESGCVSVIPGTHREVAEHRDTFADDNILTRGQEVGGIDPEAAVHLELLPGQMSLHHPWLVHGSQPNRTTKRRVGVAMQSYLCADVLPQRGEHHVLHIAGGPVQPPFIEATRPTGVCTPEARATRSAANAALADVLYADADHRREL